MNKIAEYFAKKKVSFYILVVALLFQLIALILYAVTGITIFTLELSATVIVLSILTILVGVAIIVLSDLKIGGEVGGKVLGIGVFFVYLLGLMAWIFHITSEINYIMSIAVNIDGTPLSVTFVMTVVVFALAWISALVAAIMYRAESKVEPQLELSEVKEDA